MIRHISSEAEDYVSRNERERRQTHIRPRRHSLPSKQDVRVQMPVARNALSHILDRAGLFRQLEHTKNKIGQEIPGQTLENVLAEIQDDELNIVRSHQIKSFLEVYQDYWEDFKNGENLQFVREVILQERSQPQTGNMQESVQAPPPPPATAAPPPPLPVPPVPPAPPLPKISSLPASPKSQPRTQPLTKPKQSLNPPNPELEMQMGIDLDVTDRQVSLESKDFAFSMKKPGPRTIRGLIVTHGDRRLNLDAVGTLQIHTEKRKDEIRDSKTFAQFLGLVRNVLLEQSRAVSNILMLGEDVSFALYWQFPSLKPPNRGMIYNSEGSFQGLCTYPGMGGGKGGAEYMIDFRKVEFKILKRNKDVEYYVGDASGLPVVIQILSNGEIDLMSTIPPGMPEGYGNMVLQNRRRVISEGGDDKRIEEESLKQMYQWKENNSYIAQAQKEFRDFLEVYYNYMQEKGFHKYEDNKELLSTFIDAVIQEAKRRKLDRNAMGAILQSVIENSQRQAEAHVGQEVQ